MRLIPQSPKRTLNKAFLKQRPLRSQMDLFKAELIILLGRIDTNETEEFHKNIVSDFLKKAIYQGNNFINTKGRQDLVIHNGKDNKTQVGVIIEAKRPGNKADWFTAEKPNGKVMHELVLYYLRERIEANNIDIKYLIATNINEWYIIEVKYFENIFFKNKAFVKNYEEWRDGRKVTKDTNLFYNEIAKPFIDQSQEEIPCTYFNIQNYTKALKNEDKEDDKNLIALLKILSPQHLLKVPFANDSNELDDKFYKELLHIIGLEEAKEGTKNIIRRKVENKNSASLLEMIIKKLRTKGIHKIADVKAFGETADEQYFNIALELCITWINRILFLKLLEGQLVSYHKFSSPKREGRKDEAYSFLNSKTICDFDELFKLFHNVLAINIKDREEEIQQKYKLVPYLNSSLFEITELEDVTLCIDSMDNSETLEYSSTSILKEKKKKKDQLKTLEYIFQFLDAYDFASEGSEDIQEDNKPLINASVLGKVFEKINGYKDGSIYTPGFITMYICRQSIRMAVVQKFNDAKNWNVATFDDLYNKIEDTKEANNIINDIKLCDPAVGSGHFLVSALNEIIAIKSELKILQDKKGKRLKEYTVEVENDELYVTDEYGEIFEYIPQNKESQRIQETLFLEKQTIIENCLFGVDINPNSVKICRLRLWIELLKNAYYKAPSPPEKAGGEAELETLPNIDINIKCGNSLISRFPLDADLSKALKSIKYDITAYRSFVNDYKSCKDRDTKRGLQKIIDSIKGDLRTNISQSNPKKKRLDKLLGELYHRFTGNTLFEDDAPYGDKKNKDAKNEKEKLDVEIDKLSKELDEIKNNAIYKNAFEWRFEFPEVLNNNGEFEGFDVVIGNPPYISLESFSISERDIFKRKHEQVERKYESSVLFILEGNKLLKEKGVLSYIAPITWQTGGNYSKLRKYFIESFGIDFIINLPFNTFENVYVETAIYNFSKSKLEEYKIFNFGKKELNDNLKSVKFTSIKYSKLKAPDYKIILDTSSNNILERFNNEKFISLGSITKSTQGLSGSMFPETKKSGNEIFPFLKKGNVYNYDLTIEEIYNTDLSDKKSLQTFYLDEEKVLIRRIVNRQDRLSVGFTHKKMVFKKDINPFIPIENNYSAKFLLAILASKYISYLYVNSSTIATKDDFRQTTLFELRSLPIPKISSNEQQPFINLVDKILEAKQQGDNTIDLEKQIDELVYDLYGITEEEKKVIEGN